MEDNNPLSHVRHVHFNFYSFFLSLILEVVLQYGCYFYVEDQGITFLCVILP